MARRKELSSNAPFADVLEREKIDIKEPRKYAVYLHNDDFTTQEFVVHVITRFFHKDESEAISMMLKVHMEGRARIATYSKDIALSKVSLVIAHSRQNGMPLLATAEPL
jgi:ATP-dependent Clp protease adaptor protein ClpS